MQTLSIVLLYSQGREVTPSTKRVHPALLLISQIRKELRYLKKVDVEFEKLVSKMR